MTTNDKTILNHGKLGRLVFDNSGVADAALMLAGASIPVDVSFQGAPTIAALEGPARLAADLTALDASAREAMAADLARGEEGDALDLYKSHHVEELGEALNQHFGVDALAKLEDAVFIAGLKLARVGIYPEDPDAALVCDYTIDAAITTYLIAVSFSGEGKVTTISMES